MTKILKCTTDIQRPNRLQLRPKWNKYDQKRRRTSGEIKEGRLGCSNGGSKLRAEELGGGDHGSKGWNDFSILASFEAAVGVHPEDVVVQDGKHFLRPLGDLFRGGDSGRVDVVDSRANAGSIFDSLTEHREELLIRARVFDGDHVRVHVNDRVDDVIEVRVAHVCMDLHKDNAFIHHGDQCL